MKVVDIWNWALLVVGVVVNLGCVYLYGRLFTEPRELILRLGRDLMEYEGRGFLYVVLALMFVPVFYAIRCIFGRFASALFHFRTWGIERAIFFWFLHYCLIGGMFWIKFALGGRWGPALLVACLVLTTILLSVTFSWRRIGRIVVRMSEHPTDGTVSKVVAFGANSIPFLLATLEYSNYNARTAAAYACGQLGIRTPPIIEALKVGAGSTDEIFRMASIEALRVLQPSQH